MLNESSGEFDFLIKFSSFYEFVLGILEQLYLKVTVKLPWINSFTPAFVGKNSSITSCQLLQLIVENPSNPSRWWNPNSNTNHYHQLLYFSSMIFKYGPLIHVEFAKNTSLRVPEAKFTSEIFVHFLQIIMKNDLFIWIRPP